MTSGELFKKIAKQVHPDLNGGGTRFNDMMKEALKHRNDGDALVRLARKWGIDIGGSFTYESKKTYEKRVFEAIVGAIVDMAFTYKNKTRRVKGIITNVRHINTKGYRGVKEYSVYDAVTKSVWKVKSNHPTFSVVGMASESQLMIAIEGHRKVNQSNNPVRPVRKNPVRPRNTGNVWESLGIRPNINYCGSGYRVMYQTAKGLKYGNILRTTAKCLVVEALGRKESLVRVGKVLKIIKK